MERTILRQAKVLVLKVMRTRHYLEGRNACIRAGFGAWQLGGSRLEGSRLGSRGRPDDSDGAGSTASTFLTRRPITGWARARRDWQGVQDEDDRSKVVINSKFGRLDNGEVDFSSKHIRGSVERSLKRLNVDFLDSVIIHSPPIEFLDGNKNDHYAILERLQEEGKIMAYGASVDFEEEINLLMETTNAKVIQSFFNIFHQDCKRSL